jgi:hypothetical protein
MARGTTTEIQRAYTLLAAQSGELGILATHVEDLAWLFQRLTPAQRREWAAQFHNAAGKLPYVEDCDFGALVLECVADSVFGFGEIRSEIQRYLYTEAIFRARECAQAATAGGEGIARAQHLSRLDEKLRNAA